MATESTTGTAKPAAKKSTRKTAAKKATKAKADAKSTLQEQFKATQAKVKESLEKAGDLVKDVLYVQLGVAGKVYDSVSERLEDLNEKIESGRKQAPKQWDSLIKRGSQVQSSIEKAQEDLKGRVQSVDLKAQVQSNVDKVKDTVEDALDKVRGAANKAA